MSERLIIICEKLTHLVQSSEIATSCVYQNLFKLDYPYGAIRSDKDYLIVNTVHDIMSLCMGGPIIENWQYNSNDYENLTEKIVQDSYNIMNEVINYTLDIKNKENRSVQHDFKDRIDEIYRGLVTGICKRLMKKYDKPDRIITEITITNIKDHHEGRIDALLEYHYGYGILDWKTYDLNKTISDCEKWQLIVNSLLANYRYCQEEDDWNKHNFSCIVHNSGAYFPKLETIKKEVNKIKNNRKFAFEVLCGRHVHAERPSFCPVCDKGMEGSKECLFYQIDSKLAHEGKLPAQYDKMTR